LGLLEAENSLSVLHKYEVRVLGEGVNFDTMGATASESTCHIDDAPYRFEVVNWTAVIHSDGIKCAILILEGDNCFHGYI